ncbi:hypothetical protein C8R44DRAFT_753833 [Mycena epipterygia]|nr:hypothetical protein C8R44DRAFT_753833 [Mycena epipterygia]
MSDTMQEPSSDGYHVLTCGAEEESYTYGSSEPCMPQILPEPLDGEARRVIPSTRKSNGCGAEIHIRACRDKSDASGFWVAPKDGVADVVIPLDTQHFPPDVARNLKIGVRNCCLISGVGCAACGNALGCLKTKCAFHNQMAVVARHPRASYDIYEDDAIEHPRFAEASYTFLPSAVSPPLPDAPTPTVHPPIFFPGFAPGSEELDVAMGDRPAFFGSEMPRHRFGMPPLHAPAPPPDVQIAESWSAAAHSWNMDDAEHALARLAEATSASTEDSDVFVTFDLPMGVDLRPPQARRPGAWQLVNGAWTHRPLSI